jgi:hypothetical protein
MELPKIIAENPTIFTGVVSSAVVIFLGSFVFKKTERMKYIDERVDKVLIDLRKIYNLYIDLTTEGSDIKKYKKFQEFVSQIEEVCMKIHLNIPRKYIPIWFWRFLKVMIEIEKDKMKITSWYEDYAKNAGREDKAGDFSDLLRCYELYGEPSFIKRLKRRIYYLLNH